MSDWMAPLDCLFIAELSTRSSEERLRQSIASSFFDGLALLSAGRGEAGLVCLRVAHFQLSELDRYAEVIQRLAAIREAWMHAWPSWPEVLALPSLLRAGS